MITTCIRHLRSSKAAVLSSRCLRQTVSPLLLSRSEKPTFPIGDSPSFTYPQQTPHSGRHFLPSHPAYKPNRQRSSWLWWLRRRWHHRDRFMEGWYYRLTLPSERISFAFIVSIEDPGRSPPSELRLACVQVVGPKDGYLVQATKDDSKFWAWKHVQGLGCVFSCQPKRSGGTQRVRPSVVSNQQHPTYLPPDELNEMVESGFQIVVPWQFWGRIHGHDGTLGGVLEGQGVPGYCAFDFSVQPRCGWGGTLARQQKSTGGWLASFRVFEPHWQVTMADGRATGTVTWKNQVYNFSNAPFYVSTPDLGLSTAHDAVLTSCTLVLC
jgi:tocopherol cyclase